MNKRLKILIAVFIAILAASVIYYILKNRVVTPPLNCWELPMEQCQKEQKCEWLPPQVCPHGMACEMWLTGGCRPKGYKPSPITSIYDNSPEYSRFEGDNRLGECEVNSQCTIGGCNHELCDDKINIGGTLCNVVQKNPQAKNCQCINTTCIWTK